MYQTPTAFSYSSLFRLLINQESISLAGMDRVEYKDGKHVLLQFLSMSNSSSAIALSVGRYCFLEFFTSLFLASINQSISKCQTSFEMPP